MIAELTSEARERLDLHLDDVEEILRAAGRTREQRRAVVDDLETQVLEMLAGKTSLNDVEEILARLDPPGAYGPAVAAKSFESSAPAPAGSPASPGSVKFASSALQPKRRSILKPAVLICLIMCGTLLVMTPEITGQLHAQRVANLLALRADMTSISLNVGTMTDGWRFLFWLTGASAIGLGAIGGFVAFAVERKSPSR